MWWFRKSFLKRIYKRIKSEKVDYCCLVWSWHSVFICWKDLKEVQDNITSHYISEHVRGNKDNRNCRNVWFYTKGDRLGFLNECITKSYKNK